MSEPIIVFDEVSKKYDIGSAKHGSLRETIVSRLKRRPPAVADEFWALKDVSFELGRGETLGIIGSNGAGKTTTLKLLSKIAYPTSGEVRVMGKIGALIEVGAGFHPELTGRENVFLNGSIMGLKIAEIKKKFDEIVAFAEVEKFIDMPVKHYSSGMYVRLGFAVAAHMDPDILLVDEVLSVGDYAFQKKCLEHMNKLIKSDKTVIFVSHSLATIESFCKNTIWLEHGRILEYGASSDIVKEYINKQNEITGGDFLTLNRTGTGEVRVSKIEILDSNERVRDSFNLGEDIVIRIHYKKCVQKEIGLLDFIIGCWTDTKILVFSSYSIRDKLNFKCKDSGIVDFKMEKVNILGGRYLLNVHIADEMRNKYDSIMSAVCFRINVSSFVDGSTLDNKIGIIRPPGYWRCVE